MATRKRLSPEESRATAIQAARALLIEAGPQAVTLKAVGARVGRTHANLLHHFGSAAGLQRDLAAHLAQTVCESVAEAVLATRAGLGSPREIVDIAFDAFEREGGGALVSWMLATGHEDAIEPFVETIHSMVDDLNPEEDGHEDAMIAHRVTHTVVLLALGQSLIGEPLAKSLRLPDSVARDMAERIIDEDLVGRHQLAEGN
ncbi:TetR/AcrR family transcriptional regulator [Erythrobacter litoralis]|uniref:Transcriptional regulator, TetR family protein n=1 Tax=Erythrobacter litoralis (strain HTCC2594) TaxID=314225 RepID=Q2NCD3_ERYLH|nr:helix-turn-helix domain-containing protein [Erythrobacter litoralis]ABC62658.1 transcriptional regulator, TetR family protein [Erythrobacter litoralis HTCC2594]